MGLLGYNCPMQGDSHADPAHHPSACRTTVRLALGAIALAALGAAHASYFNANSGAPLRAGVYGRVEVHGAPPPLISPQPVIAKRSLGPVRGEPLYFYLPAGQVRKWEAICQRYSACERPVYFVRVDNAPGKLGRWKARMRPQPRPEATTLAGLPGF